MVRVMTADTRKFSLLLVIAVCFLFFGAVPSQAQDQNNESPPPPAGSTPALNYLIGPEGVLDIDVFEVPKLNKAVRVANDGAIYLEFFGRVQAAGVTAQQLRQELESKWGETYLENP